MTADVAGKNIVLCLDGTGNEYDRDGTNVLRLHRALDLDDGQIAFYDPGVGTFSVGTSFTRPGRALRQSLGLAFGFGLRENVIEAYRFLMRHWEPGDRIFVLGFSRGAYTARVVAALVHAYGVLRRGLDDLVPYALRYLEKPRGEPDFRRIAAFKRQFSQPTRAPIRFLGVWDTVASVSWVFDHVVYLYTKQNRSIEVVRHAVALDERRAFFRTNLTAPTPRQNHKEVWFPGVHSDIGGGYPTCESGLSKVALEWMMVEARATGLRFDAERAERVLYAPAETAAGTHVDASPSPTALMHNSLRGAWWLCEVFPKYVWRQGHDRLHLNLGRHRRVPDGATLHASVVDRMATGNYAPNRLPESTETEPSHPFDERADAVSRPLRTAAPERETDANVSGAIASAGGAAIAAGIGTTLVTWAWSSGLLPAAAGGLLWFGWIWDSEHMHGYWRLSALALLWPIAFLIGAAVIGRPLAETAASLASRRDALPPDERPGAKARDRWLHGRRSYSAADVADFLDRIGENGRAAYRYVLVLDFAFIASYTAAFLLVWRWAGQPGTTIAGLSWMVLAIALGAIADVVENSLLLAHLRRLRVTPGARMSTAAARAASTATLIKMVAIIAAVGCLEFRLVFAGLINAIRSCFAG